MQRRKAELQNLLHSHRNTCSILRADAEGVWALFRSSTPAHLVPLNSTYLCKSMALTRAALGTKLDTGSGDPVQQVAGLFQGVLSSICFPQQAGTIRPFTQSFVQVLSTASKNLVTYAILLLRNYKNEH